MMVDEIPRAPEPHEVEFGELPELTRALRAFGSARRSPGAMHSLFFRPLLDARRKAAEARTPAARVRAFDAAELGAGLERCVARIVVEWPDAREQARRAIRAQIAERVVEYQQALGRLDAAAAQLAAAEEPGRLPAWRLWTVQLHATFQAADRAWVSIQAVVASLNARRGR